jgi:hypothetical protein
MRAILTQGHTISKETAKTADPFWIAEANLRNRRLHQRILLCCVVASYAKRRSHRARKVSAKGATVAGGQLTSALPRPRP